MSATYRNILRRWCRGYSTEPVDEKNAIIELDGDKMETVAFLPISRNRAPRIEQNKRLILAAPELLEVCKQLEERSQYWSDYDVPQYLVARLRVAIIKATKG